MSPNRHGAGGYHSFVRYAISSEDIGHGKM